jgi:hypothetical protein
MNYIKSKQGISSFCISDNQYIYTTINKEILLNDVVLFQSKESLQEIYCVNEVVYTNTINGYGVVIDISNKKIIYLQNEFLKYLDNKFKITFENGKSKIFSKDNQTITIKESKIFRFIIQKNTSRFLYYEGTFFDTLNHKIIYSSLLKNETYFIFLLSTLGSWLDGEIEKPYQVSEFCDIYNKILISTLNNGDILLLDIEKGEPIKLFKETKIIGGLFQKEENSPIYIGLKFKTYIEINIEKAEIIKKIDLEQYFKQKFNRSTLVPINTTIYQNELIYFIADTNIVGVFDPNKTEVIDYYEFNFENKQTMLKGGKENLQVKDNNIYCLDNQNTLYTLSFTSPS